MPSDDKSTSRCRPPLPSLLLLLSAAVALTSSSAAASRAPAGRRPVARSPVDIFDGWRSADDEPTDDSQRSDRSQAVATASAAWAQTATTKVAPPAASKDSATAAAPSSRTTAVRSPIWLTMTPNGTINVTEGEGRDIHCRIYNKPQSAQVQWYYIKRRPNGYGFSNYTVIANQHLTINFEKFRTAHSDQGVFTLSIRYFELGDDGQYSCFLYVGFSEAYRESVRVNVLPRGMTTTQNPAPGTSSASKASTATSASTAAATVAAPSDSRTAATAGPGAAATAGAGAATNEVPTAAESHAAPPTSAAPRSSSPTAASSAASAATATTTTTTTANPSEGRGSTAARPPTQSASAAASATPRGLDQRPHNRTGVAPREKISGDARSKTAAPALPPPPQPPTAEAVTAAHEPSRPTDVALDGSELEHMLPEVETQPWSRGSPSTKAATTRCEYQLVINEVDASSCPSLSRGGGGGGGYNYMSNEIYQGDASPYGEHHATSAGASALSEKINRLEDRLIDEMVKTQIVNHTMSEHDELLRRTERSLAEQARNVSALGSGLQRAEAALERQRVAGRSLDDKLASVMINLAEMSARLDKAIRKVAAIKPDDKSVDVLSAAETAGCTPLKGVTYFKDCDDAYRKGNRASDVYYVKFIYSACPVPVWCDMDTPPGGWLVLQRRRGGAQRFNMNWADYRKGFGNVSHDFWLGNDNIFLLTNQAEYMLRVDLWDFYDSRVFAEYRRFKIDGERDAYKLHVGNYSGTAKDSLQKHDGVRFSTPDRDHDQWVDYHCAMEWEAGWWFTNCWHAFLNGQYSNNTGTKFKGMAWIDWKDEQLARTEMKVRPIVAPLTPTPV